MPTRETSPAESCTTRQPPRKGRKKQLDTASCGTAKVQPSQIIVINNRKLADLIWLMLMTVTTNASFFKLDWSLLCCCAPPAQLLRCPQQLRLRRVRAPAELPPLPVSASSPLHRHGRLLLVQLKDRRVACVTAGCWHDFVKSLGNIQRCRWVLSLKNHRLLSVPWHLSSLQNSHMCQCTFVKT